MTERVLTTRELNRALLARQLLLKHARIPLARALERVAGLQAHYAPSAYVGLWSRLEGFHREDLTKAPEHRRAVQGTLMRATIHVASARDYPLFAAGVKEGRREWWVRGVIRRAGCGSSRSPPSRARSGSRSMPRPRGLLLSPPP